MEEIKKKPLDIPCSEEELKERILSGKLEAGMADLLPIERDILKLHMGLLDGCSRTFQEISELFGMSIEDAQHHCMRASRKLRHPRYYK